jgi:DNA polymerase I-like protein with 3'-5' exonuclease and polymerase domains
LDEFQADVAERDVEEYSALALRSFEVAGQYYNYRVPIVGDIKTGSNWDTCH